MARTRAAEYDERRLRIVEKAAALFAARGFHGASASDVADACAISKSAIYHYYPSKEDILFDVMASHVAALHDAAHAAAEAEGEAPAKLRRLAHDVLALYVGAKARHKVLLNELDQLAPPRRAEIVALQRDLIAIVEALLLDIAPKLAERKGAAFAAAMLFFGMINWTHTWFDPEGAVSADALADMAVNLTLGGIAAA